MYVRCESLSFNGNFNMMLCTRAIVLLKFLTKGSEGGEVLPLQVLHGG